MNSFGLNFRVSLFGESHGAGIGVLMDGVPAGIGLSAKDFADDLSKRKSGAAGTTARREDDLPEILSGVHAGHTVGTPVAVLFRNMDVRSSDYSLFREIPRPGHADFVAGVKWHDFNDPRGGGHFSGRLTLALVTAGVVAKKMLRDERLLSRLPVRPEGDDVFRIRTEITEIGGVSVRDVAALHDGETEPSVLWREVIEEVAGKGDSAGGVVQCTVEGVPVGLGEPFFNSVESLVSHLMFSIPGVRGVEFGDGFAAARMRGSQHNDPFIAPDGTTLRNGSGGVNGGISNGNPIVFRVAFKPASSIAAVQETWNFTEGGFSSMKIPGRHDACFVLRTPVIVGAGAAIVLADLLSSI